MLHPLFKNVNYSPGDGNNNQSQLIAELATELDLNTSEENPSIDTIWVAILSYNLSNLLIPISNALKILVKYVPYNMFY